ncbi:MAG TPA: hypothetical protein VKF14_15770 [Candidatus Dormibacteraeota bacterium]|nr:hypothetical protein [Candidatus Dormibacteraeota bacterium]
MVGYAHNWGEHRVLFRKAEDERVHSILASWTDVEGSFRITRQVRRVEETSVPSSRSRAEPPGQRSGLQRAAPKSDPWHRSHPCRLAAQTGPLASQRYGSRPPGAGRPRSRSPGAERR